MEKILPSLAGYAFGFLLAYLLFGKHENAVGLLPNLRFSLGIYKISVHHWAPYLAAALILLGVQTKTHFLPTIVFYFLIAALIGGFSQGITYKDWDIWIK